MTGVRKVLSTLEREPEGPARIAITGTGKEKEERAVERVKTSFPVCASPTTFTMSLPGTARHLEEH